MNRNIRKLVLVFLCSLATVAEAASGAGHRILISDGHADALYRLGEEAVFTLTVEGNIDRKLSKDGTVKVTMDSFGGEKIVERVWDPEKEPVLTLKGVRTDPGFLRVMAVTKPTDDVWGIGDGNACWSVGYEPTKIVGATPYPKDFDSYWKGELDRLEKTVPVDFRIERQEALSKLTHDVWRVSVATFGNGRIWGYLIEPKERSQEKLPLAIRIAGAGSAYCGAHVAGFMKTNECALIMNVHRYAPAATQKEQDGLYYELNASYRKRYGGKVNYSTGGAGVSREEYYFHDAIVGLVRLSNQIVSRPEIDLSRVWYTGSSQGTGMGLALTALNPAICRSFFRVPALADLCGFRKGRQSGWPLLVERQTDAKSKATAEEVAQYYDAVNFAHLVKVPVRIVVGFADNCCPPYGGYSVFNALQSKDKEIINGLGMWHVTAPAFDRQGEAWLRKRP